MKIGRLICKNDKDSVASSILLDEVSEEEVLPKFDMLINDREDKNVFIYELFPATPSWKNMNWQN